MLQGFVFCQFGHRAAVHDTAVVHHRHAVAERAGDREVLLDEIERRVGPTMLRDLAHP